jgi:methionyl-tRNA formyltransferase
VRVVLLSTVPQVAQFYVPALEELGHETVAVVGARHRPERLTPHRAQLLADLVAHAAPQLDVLLPTASTSLAGLFRAYEPDVVVCTGYPWKVPAEALGVPRYGVINNHPSLLPRHRGPIPMAWTLREGDEVFGITWHRMDEDFDSGAILAQTTIPVLDDETTMEELGPRLGAAAISLMPRVFERLAAEDPGDPQPTEGATWAPTFEEDYAEVDWSLPARKIHDQVRAWALSFSLSDVEGPIAELDGARVRLLRTSLTERDGAVARVECGDGPLWVLEYVPA